MNEVERIRRLAQVLGRPASFVRAGIGDDAALLDWAAASGKQMVWTVDAQVEHTHFRREWLSWEDVGWRSVMAAASDVAAMGGKPVAMLAALTLSDDVDDAMLDAIVRGQAEASDALGAPIVGGNMARGTETSVTTTVLGSADGAVTRDGARPGDGLWLCGDAGAAGLGLAWLVRHASRNDTMTDAEKNVVRAWRRPVARVEAGLAMGAIASAAIDLSDGLARDATHLAEASDVAIVLDEGALLSAVGSDVAMAAKGLGLAPIDCVLYGGEDYALLAASEKAIRGFFRIGHVEKANGQRLWLDAQGKRSPIEPRGFDHFVPA